MRIFAILLMLPSFSIAQQELRSNRTKTDGVQFLENDSWSKVKEIAKAENKYILVDCYASWCGPCKEMDQQTYPDQRVGTLVNQNFVAMKIQCDTSKSDPERVRVRYADAHEIVDEFRVHAYPTFLFFTPDGRLVHKGVGYHSAKEFIDLAKSAMDSTRQFYILVKNYLAGKLGYNKMVYLADLADQFDEQKLRVSIVRAYIQGYLNHLPDSAFCEKRKLEVLLEYQDVFRTNDLIVIWLTHNYGVCDSIWQRRGISAKLFDQIVYRERVKPALDSAKETGVSPDWENLSRNVAKTFGPDHNDAVLQGRINWYQSQNDSENLCKALVERIGNWNEVKDVTNPANRETLNLYAFGVFRRSNDQDKLKNALGWMDLVVDAIVDSSRHAGEFIDTKANLLYKLGRKDEAIILESRAAAIKSRDKEIARTLQKMKEGRPTW